MSVAVFSDKFSGTLTAKEALGIIKDVFQASSINAEFFSVTDGGENSSKIFKEYGFKQYQAFRSYNCDGTEVEVESLNINGLKYFETAQLIGINSIKDTLEINSASLCEVLQKVNILGTGGSKTVDFGVGLLSKLGIDFLSNGEKINNPTPKDFPLINSVKTKEFDPDINLKVLTDTTIPLLGQNSAYDIFGPQKGLSSEFIEQHKNETERLIGLLAKELSLELNPYEQLTGAAGGLSFCLHQILGCEIDSGSKYFMETTNLTEKIKEYEIGVFCEGKFDESSFEGKIIGELLKNFNGNSYFLGGQYKAESKKLFTNIFECGEAGLSDPKGTLKIATNNLIKELT
ncbi:glycerate kinase [Acidimicrobiaceae bacterium]|nr:glycerate kinase [Acidimicrobiaceae bacterium]|tara:strand:+ start:44 stop:1078 length:1035 start_codon:yes stop_codon:yes gene_type:complete